MRNKIKDYLSRIHRISMHCYKVSWWSKLIDKFTSDRSQDLRKTNDGNYWGRCPDCTQKHFFANPSLQKFKCFSCGYTGKGLQKQ